MSVIGLLSVEAIMIIFVTGATYTYFIYFDCDASSKQLKQYLSSV